MINADYKKIFINKLVSAYYINGINIIDKRKLNQNYIDNLKNCMEDNLNPLIFKNIADVFNEISIRRLFDECKYTHTFNEGFKIEFDSKNIPEIILDTTGILTIDRKIIEKAVVTV